MLHLLVEVEAVKRAIVRRRLLDHCDLNRHRWEFFRLINILVLTETVLAAPCGVMLHQQMLQVILIDVQVEIFTLHTTDTVRIAVGDPKTAAFKVYKAIE